MYKTKDQIGRSTSRARLEHPILMHPHKSQVKHLLGKQTINQLIVNILHAVAGDLRSHDHTSFPRAPQISNEAGVSILYTIELIQIRLTRSITSHKEDESVVVVVVQLCRSP
jgi:hypothetical protein